MKIEEIFAKRLKERTSYGRLVYGYALRKNRQSD